MIPAWNPNEPAFESALKFTLWAEGGLSDDPLDSGGRTKWGITQVTYSGYRYSMKLPLQPVDMMTVDEMKSIYKNEYWDTGTCQPMHAKLAIAHFDWCVNHGAWASKKMLQEVLGVKADGAIGPKTMAAIHAQDVDELVAAYIQYRRKWYKDRVIEKPNQQRFIKGWLNRCDNISSYIFSMAGDICTGNLA